MTNWFETKVKYDKTCEDGVIRTVTEPYLVDALSYTEAEARIIEEIRPYITGEFTIANITRKKYSETFFNDAGDRYYNARLAYIVLDEKSGTEKKTNVNMLVQANSVQEALDIVTAEMKQTMIDYAIIGVTETAIMDIFLYKEE